jgi:hypothetical protein
LIDAKHFLGEASDQFTLSILWKKKKAEEQCGGNVSKIIQFSFANLKAGQKR